VKEKEMEYRLKDVLMERDGYSEEEADAIVEETREAILDIIEDGGDPEEYLLEEFQLEPDYLMELIDL